MKDAMYIQLAPIQLNEGVTEAKLLEASEAFQERFVRKQQGILLVNGDTLCDWPFEALIQRHVDARKHPSAAERVKGDERGRKEVGDVTLALADEDVLLQHLDEDPDRERERHLEQRPAVVVDQDRRGEGACSWRTEYCGGCVIQSQGDRTRRSGHSAALFCRIR